MPSGAVGGSHARSESKHPLALREAGAPEKLPPRTPPRAGCSQDGSTAAQGAAGQLLVGRIRLTTSFPDPRSRQSFRIASFTDEGMLEPPDLPVEKVVCLMDQTDDGIREDGGVGGEEPGIIGPI